MRLGKKKRPISRGNESPVLKDATLPAYARLNSSHYRNSRACGSEFINQS
jgi:hypothetical protein